MISIRKRLKVLSGPFYPLTFSLSFLKNKKFIIGVIIALALVSTYARLLIPIYIGDSVTSIEGSNVSSLIHYGYLIIAVSALSGFLQFFVSYGAQYTSQFYSYNLRKKLMGNVIRKNSRFFEKQTSGDLLSRLTMDIEATRNFVMITLSQLIPTFFMIGISLYLLYTINPIFSVTFLVTVPVLVYIGMVFQRKQRGHWRTIRAHYGRMNEEIQENIVGQRVVRSYQAEDRESGKFTGTTDAYFEEYNTVARLRGFYNNLMPLVVSASASVILAAGGYLDFISGAAVGPLVAALNIFSQMSAPVSMLGRMIVFSENASAGIGRMSVILDEYENEDLQESGGAFPEGDLEFRNVDFERNGKKILTDVNLRFEKGEFVGITGKTGAGKTTLVNLISRFYEPSSGDITVGSEPIDRIPLPILRNNVSTVYQEISLLSGSVRENISFGGDYTIEEIREAAQMACISDFIDSLPDGYDSIVGERGITLSGGQRQRVAIARALIRKPYILILDDATSSVDADTELRLYKNIRRSIPGSITLVVSHRESALAFSDRIILISSGTTEEVNDRSQIAGIIGLRMPETGGT
ncbi:MAG: ABC transporter ATP-binding protein [Thermoplasmataceae archaeon]|jgi:ABC-type multidrug transport system fused ATPase/permease subunit|nr:ABC transporter ATP-binding protein/permease [Candidatus Thermoplasmatota archaeon]